jgi:hypothetical protein
MKCSQCDSDIEFCERCNQNFQVNDHVVCIETPTGDYGHCCSDECAIDWFVYNYMTYDDSARVVAEEENEIVSSEE